jgi:hypothetical protein
MLDPFDRDRLIGWLSAQGADAELIERVQTGAELDPDGQELVVAGLLDQVDGEERVERALLGHLEALAARWNAPIDDLVEERLGTTLARLRAYGDLELPAAAPRDRIKAEHRRLAKRFHPDRLVDADLSTKEAAGRTLAKLNAARTVLLTPPAVGDDPDDLVLDDPVSIPEPPRSAEGDEDAPTQDYEELDLEESAW